MDFEATVLDFEAPTVLKVFLQSPRQNVKSGEGAARAIMKGALMRGGCDEAPCVRTCALKLTRYSELWNCLAILDGVFYRMLQNIVVAIIMTGHLLAFGGIIAHY